MNVLHDERINNGKDAVPDDEPTRVAGAEVPPPSGTRTAPPNTSDTTADDAALALLELLRRDGPLIAEALAERSGYSVAAVRDALAPFVAGGSVAMAGFLYRLAVDDTTDTPGAKATGAPGGWKKAHKTATEKPHAPAIFAENIPDTLKQQQVWLCWRWAWDDDRGEWTKPPLGTRLWKTCGGHELRKVDATKKANLGTLDEALDRVRSGHAAGIGIAVEHAGVLGVDLDDCRNPETGEIAAWATDDLKLLDTYVEISPSGTGLKALAVARKPGQRCRHGDREMYVKKRYFTITGNVLPGFPTTPQERQPQVDELYRRMFPGGDEEPVSRPKDMPRLDQSDEELLERAFLSRQKGELIRALWNGDTSAYGGDTSRADLALCRLLGFYFQTPERVESIFSRSALGSRTKWTSRPDYRQRTTRKALEGVTEFYDPARYRGPTVTIGRPSARKRDQSPPSANGQATNYEGHEQPAAPPDYDPTNRNGAAAPPPPPPQSPTDTDEPGGAELPMAWDNPERLATGFIKQWTLWFIKDHNFVYDERKYVEVSDPWLNGIIRAHCTEEAAREYTRQQALQQGKRMTAAASTGDEPEKGSRREEKGLSTVPKVTRDLVANVAAAVRALRQLPDDVLPGTWIGPNRKPLPTQRNVLALDNCLLDLDTGERLHHTPNWFSLTALPVRYDPKAPKPQQFIHALGELMLGDQTLIDVVWEAFGACLDPKLLFKYTVAFVGDGDSGKTAIITALMTLLGMGNYSTTSMVRLTQRFGTYALFGKLANIVDDESGAELSDEAAYRRFTGGAPIDYEQKGKSVFSGLQTAKLIFSTNRLPKFDDEIDANYNRLAAIPCRYVVPADKQVPGMRAPEYWASELSGILNMALEGHRRLIRQGNRLTASPAMARTVQKHRRETNHVRCFLEENYQLDPKGSVPTDRLYGHYTTWCETSGIQDRERLDKIKFGVQVKKVFKASTSSTDRPEGGESIRCRFGITRKPTH